MEVGVITLAPFGSATVETTLLKKYTTRVTNNIYKRPIFLPAKTSTLSLTGKTLELSCQWEMIFKIRVFKRESLGSGNYDSVNSVFKSQTFHDFFNQKIHTPSFLVTDFLSL